MHWHARALDGDKARAGTRMVTAKAPPSRGPSLSTVRERTPSRSPGQLRWTIRKRAPSRSQGPPLWIIQKRTPLRAQGPLLCLRKLTPSQSPGLPLSTIRKRAPSRSQARAVALTRFATPFMEARAVAHPAAAAEAALDARVVRAAHPEKTVLNAPRARCEVTIGGVFVTE
ncbi:hypothetical protein DFH11DRAFT_1730762 [Phellopilus nigrolimitatus]|nr:hypothetical protein DFH11DRAFT_1730762 [Phellopilus nigrolimitatus]